MKISLLKISVAILLILLTSGAWVALDYMNRQEQEQAKSIQNSMTMIRMESQKRNQQQASFETTIQSFRNNCEAAADKANADYVALAQKLMPPRRQPVVLPPALQAEAAALLASAKTACQQSAEELLKKGL